ncbi:serine hydrolase domain-containing protein [Thermocrispum sp.]|uniref:Serine hydrolase n=2 Tax=Thermocrispum agreste TaxID=37925 RepID=A0A2W4IY70_9PSEU|nr:serine hydrolase domain-containing protein [Thermocrispum sp.]PZM91702.1 MAG: serine hydrolase [Thermocrispum agreste]
MLPTTEYALLSRLATEQVRGRAPSLVAGVVRDGELVWSAARGFVDGSPPDNDTQYRIGSITKTLIAVLVMRLRDEGKLALDDPIGAHLGQSPFGHLTVAQLLSHTGGLTSEAPGSWWERSPGGDWAELAAGLTPEQLKLRAGKQFHYSNVGYGVLGELVGRLRGSSWLEALKAEVLDPLGMTRTTPHPDDHAAQGWAVHPFADVVLPEPAPDTGAMAPAGQLWSTVHDLSRLTSLISGHTSGVLSADTVAEMRAVATVEDGAQWLSGYGLGLQLARRDGRAYAGHTGSMPGFVACTMVDTESGTGALAMANTTSGVPILAFTLDLIALADQHEPPLPQPWQPAEVDTALLELTGLWHWGPTPHHLRILPNGWLYLAPVGDGGRRSRFRPTGPDEWVGLDGYYAGETLRVGRDADGKPRYLDLATFIFTRTPYDPEAPVPGGVDPKGWR